MISLDIWLLPYEKQSGDKPRMKVYYKVIDVSTTGTGRETCPTCKGIGKIDCVICKGSGRNDYYPNGKCAACKFRGYGNSICMGGGYI